MSDFSWPPSLVKDLARRRVVIVIGSGVSKHSVSSKDNEVSPPLWKQLLLDAYNDISDRDAVSHIHDAINDGDLLHGCEWLKRKYDENWNRFLRSKFYEPQYKVSELHNQIALLDSRIVFSLNFDEIYENAAREVYDNSLYIKNYYDSDVSEFLRGDERYIVKVHGNISSPDNIIFTQKDYAKARAKYSYFYSMFDAALLTHTFLFIGCGYSDPDISLLLENQNFNLYEHNAQPHYFVTADEIHDDLAKSLRENRNLKVLTYKKLDDKHTGLNKIIENLVKEVDGYREELLKNNNW